MAKGKGVGLTSKPPKAQYTRAERQAFKSGAVADPRQNKQPKYQGLNDQQAQVVNNINQSDIGLSGFNNQQMQGVFDAYQTPYTGEGLPVSPWEQGQTIEQMNTEYYDKALSNYDRSMQDKYKQEDADFEQQMYNRGIPLGSSLYNTLKAETQKTRDSARQNAMDSAYFNAGQNATTWNNLGTQNFQNAYGYQMDQRNRPASEYATIQGLISGMPGQNLGYNQALGLQGNQQAHDKWMMKNTPRGGGGGGGGQPPVWAQYGFTSPMEYDAYKQQQARDAQSWEWANNPQYKQPKQPSPWTGFAGSIIGAGVGGWAQSGFDW